MGLRYILFITDTKATTLSESIDVSVQFINDWVKGRKSIPDKHLPKLEGFFGVEEEYYKKKLTLKDKLHIDLKLMALENNLDPLDIELIHRLSEDKNKEGE